MSPENGMGTEYYVGVLPKPPRVDDQWVQIIAQKLRELRISILLESEKALGRSSLEVEMGRDEKTYREEIEDPTRHCLVCCQYRSGMQGRVLTNAKTRRFSADGNSAYQSPNEHDKEIMKMGKWVGVMYAFGPLTTSNWVLPSLHDEFLGTEERYHMSSLYIHQSNRRTSPRPGTTLFEAMGDALFAQLVAQIRSTHSIWPVLLRQRITVSSENVAQSSLVKRYQKGWDYSLTGWIPKAAALLVNRGQVDEWPAPEQDNEFYCKCDWAVMESICQIDETSVTTVTENSVVAQPRL